MKKLGLIAVVLAAASALAQDAQPQGATQPTAPQAGAQQAQPAQPQVALTNEKKVSDAPTANDMYCSGFILKDGLQRAGRIVGGWDSPFQTRFSSTAMQSGTVFLDSGSFGKDQQFAVVRPVKDPNKYQLAKSQRRDLRAAGQYYLELGRIRVMDVQKGMAIAHIELSCDAMVPGDIAIPWADRPVPQYRRETAWEFYAPPNGKATGTLLMGREFDVLAAQRGKVYLNIGQNQGLKAGDYLRVTRTYPQLAANQADNLSNKASVVDSNHMEPLRSGSGLMPSKTTRFDALPRKSIGELMVLYTTGTTATATVTRSWEQLQAGDGVELMDEPPPLPPPQQQAMNPPTISCSATPATVRVGESATIRCTGASPDNREMTYAYASDVGAVSGRGESAVLNTANAQPGVATVTATLTDDRGQAATATTQVNIQAAEVPQASSMGSFTFRPNSAYVNNEAKALLDQVALRLQREPGSSVMLVGHISGREAARLAIARATNAKNYLVKEKGIDTTMAQVADGGPGQSTVDVWFVPAGAAMPQVVPADASSAQPKQ